MPPFCFVGGHKRHLRPHLCYVNTMLRQFFHLGQNWHIDKGFATAALSKHANNMRMMELGATFADIFIDAKKESEAVEYVNVKGGKIAIVPLKGVMMLESGLCNAGIQRVSNILREQTNNPEVLAIIVDANTGGGEALAGQEFSNAVAESTKPVLFYAHFLASAGVMASLHADEVYAAGNQTEVGSIGVMATINKDFLDWYKETFTSYYAETSPNKNEELRGLIDGDSSKLIEALNRADERFMADVKKYRPLKGSKSTIEETLSGRMFSADDAQARGLIDGIKTKAEVIARAEQLANQYLATGKPKKGKKMTHFLAGTKLGDMLGINADSEQDDATVKNSIDTKFTEMEATVSNLTTKAADADAAKTAAELKANTLTARVAELEALNTQLSEKAIEVNAANEALLAKVASLESDKAGLSTQLAALSLKSTAVNTAPNQESDSSVIEAAAKKVFGGTVNVK